MKIKLSLKIVLVFVLILCVFGIANGIIISQQVSKMIVTEKLSSESNLGYCLLNIKYPGDWSVKDGKLYKGDIIVNDNKEIMALFDEMKKQTETLATVFMGSTRVATNVVNNGVRAVGTKAASDVIERVLENKKEFIGEANVVGKVVHTKYIPLTDASGRVVGMWFVGVDKGYINERVNSLIVSIVIITLILIAIGTGIAILLGISITRPILGAVANLNIRAGEISSASQQLSASSQQLAEGNAEQAASIQETSSTLEESLSTVKQNSENTKQAALLAAQTKASADKGNMDVQEMMNSMSDIKKSSDQIAKIIKVIDDIAFQTNILALNAAVEAARAGEAGMGFAVVAEEVRNLAQRSAQAAKDTAAMIETNIELSENGVGMARKVASSLSDITAQAGKVNELMDEIAAASQEQTQGIAQINKAIAQMENVTQMNAASAEQSASSSEELSNQAMNLKDIVQKLVYIVNGHIDHAADLRQQYIPAVNTAAPVYYANNRNVVETSGATKTRAIENRNTSVDRTTKRTNVVKPEDIIPLKDDMKDY